jgi:membrane associated rhomboid family serine protease
MRIPLVTKVLLWALGLAYALQVLAGPVATAQLMLWPVGDVPKCIDVACTQSITVGFRPWQLVTYALLHDPHNLGHLFLNALALFQFGPSIEQAWGPKRYAIYLLVCVVGAGLLQLAVAASGFGGPAAPVLGASGGVYAVLLAFGMLFPNRRLMLLIPPVPMSARTMVIVFGALSLLLGLTGAQAGIAHFVHLGGMLFGFVLIRLWRAGPNPPQPPPVAM